MYLDLTPGAGNLLGLYEWEILSPWLGESLTLNTGPAPRKDADVYSLWQILQASVPPKYYLSQKACLGILRRAKERGKLLPEQLETALKLQAGITICRILKNELRAYHINQRDEGIDLHGVSGALMATSNQQMQTFVTGPPVAFAENQRNEVRDLHDVAGALAAQPGIKQQTFIANGDISQSNGDHFHNSGADQATSILCLNDQGGERMDLTEGVTATLRAQMGGHQPIVVDVHGQDSRYKITEGASQTVTSAFGEGGGNTPLVVEDQQVYCIAGNIIDRKPKNGGNGQGFQEGVSYTITTEDRYAVFARQRVDEFHESNVSSTESARQHKDATDLVYQKTVGALTSSDKNGPNSQYVSQDKLIVEPPLLIRRLTPLECERLQGFPDGWTDILGASDSARYKALGNSVAIPCVDYIMKGLAIAIAYA